MNDSSRHDPIHARAAAPIVRDPGPPALPELRLAAGDLAWGEDLVWLARTRLQTVLDLRSSRVRSLTLSLHTRPNRERADRCGDVECRVAVELHERRRVEFSATRASAQAAIIAALIGMGIRLDPGLRRGPRWRHGAIPA